MNDQPKVYIAGIGMITPIGANTAMTAAAVRAGVSAYRASDYFTHKTRQPITMACVPDEVFASAEFEIDEGSYFNRIVIMAIIALRETLAGRSIEKPIPLILSQPEPRFARGYIGTKTLMTQLLKQKELPLHPDLIRTIDSGRVAGIEGLALAQHYLYRQKADYVLVGGSDSYRNIARLGEYDKAERLLTPESKDGFAPGEAAGFLLLTNRPEQALARNGRIVALNPPGVAEEPGHLDSEEPYRGDGLDRAFKQGLAGYTGDLIHTVYSSMNGENHWAKEYGVAYTRNREYFLDTVKIEHPADCYGDLGAATGAVLIGLAAESLWKHTRLATHLAYASADGPMRAAVRMETIPTTSMTRIDNF